MKTTIKKGIVHLENPIVDKENDYSIDKINLNKLVARKIASDSIVDGIALDRIYNPINTDNENDKLTIKYNMQYEDETGITLTGSINKQDKEIFKIDANINIDTLVTQVTDSITNKNNKNINIASLSIIQDTLKDIKDKLYSAAFTNNVLLSNEEFNYRIDIYKSGTDNLLGIANIMFIDGNVMMLSEVIAFDSNASLSKIDIKMVIDENNAVIFKGLTLNSESGKSIKYCSFDLNDAKVAKKQPGRGETYNAEKLKLKGLKLPYKDMSTKYLLDELIKQNEHGNLIKCYKQNKSMNIVKINVNKYLLG